MTEQREIARLKRLLGKATGGATATDTAAAPSAVASSSANDNADVAELRTENQRLKAQIHSLTKESCRLVSGVWFSGIMAARGV